jgi:hypothetical protein
LAGAVEGSVAGACAVWARAELKVAETVRRLSTKQTNFRLEDIVGRLADERESFTVLFLIESAAWNGFAIVACLSAKRSELIFQYLPLCP